MHRFNALKFVDGYFTLTETDIYQLKKVLRVKNNESIICLYNNEFYQAQVINTQEQFIVKALEKLSINNELNVKIKIVMSLIRANRWDYFLQKSTELGCCEIIPYIAENSIIKLDQSEYKKKVERWNKICKEAAEQSFRNHIPIMHNIVDNYQDLSQYTSELNLVCHEKVDATKTKLSEYLSKDVSSITIFIGPEGGFSNNEVEYFKANYNCDIISLGKRILRAETAPLMLLSNIIYEKELK